MKTDTKWKIVAFTSILITTVIVFHGTLQSPWYFDDQANILENSVVTNLGNAWQQILAPRGLTILTFALNYHFHGFDLRSFHLVNLAIHSINACIIYLILNNIFKDNKFLALMGALIFLAHPINTQAVNYIVQRMTILCSLFTFTATYLYFLARRQFPIYKFFAPRHLFIYIAFLMFSVLAVMTKQNAATLPVMLLLTEFFIISNNQTPLNRKRAFLYLSPLFIAPAVLTMTIVLLPTFSMSSLSVIGNTENLLNSQEITNVPLHYFFTQFTVLWIYIKQLIFPYPQVLDYGYPLVEKLFTLQNIVAGTGLLCVICFAWFIRNRFPLITFGVFWFFVALIVESSFIPLDPIFEHRLYTPIFGYIVILLFLFDSGFKKHSTRNITVFLYVIILISGSIYRNSVWAKPIDFFTNEVNHTYASYRPHMMLANAYYEAGNTDESKRTYDIIVAAIENKSIQNVQPRMLVNIAVAYERFGEYKKAESLLKLALSRNFGYFNAHYNLGVVYYRMGFLKLANDEFKTSSRLRPSSAAALRNYASVSLELGDMSVAEKVLPEVMSLSPVQGRELFNEMQTYKRDKLH